METLYTVTVERVARPTEPAGPDISTEIYRQTIETLDLQAVMSAVNKKPRAPRVRKAKAAA